MTYYFQRVIGKPELPRWKAENGTEMVRGLDNAEYHGVCSDQCSTVYQLHADGRRVPVAQIQHIVYYWGTMPKRRFFTAMAA